MAGRVARRIGIAVSGLTILLIIGVLALWRGDVARADAEAQFADGASAFLDAGATGRIHYRDQGPRGAPPVVLVHGTGASLHTWEPWVTRLTPDYRIVTLDLPGHGLTGATPAGDYSRSGMVAAIHAVVDHLGLERFVLGGNSMGGEMSMAYALTHPDRVRALILVDTAGYYPPHMTDREAPLAFRLASMPVLRPVLTKLTPRWVIADSLSSVVVDQSVVTDALIERYWKLMRLEGSRAALMQHFAGLPRPSLPVEALNVPTLIQWGDSDRLIPSETGHALTRVMPNARLIVYPDAGHIPMKEIPGPTAADARAFLDALAPA